VDGVLIAGTALLDADKNVREMKAFMEEVTAGDPSGNWLTRAFAADLKADGFRASFARGGRVNKHFDLSQGSGYEKRAKAMAALSAVSDLLDRKAPREAAAYKAWLFGMCKRIAEASKGGRFLGLGGALVSGAEMAALMEVCRLLNVPLPSLKDV
jgi:hypothetical protein